MRRRATGSTYTLSYLDDPPSFRLRIDRAEVNLLTSHSQLSTSQISSSFSSSSSSSSPSSSSSYPSSPSSVLQTHSELKIIREHPIESAIYLQPPPLSPHLSPSLSLTPSLPLPPHLIESSVIESRISIQLLRPDLLILMEGGGRWRRRGGRELSSNNNKRVTQLDVFVIIVFETHGSNPEQDC